MYIYWDFISCPGDAILILNNWNTHVMESNGLEMTGYKYLLKQTGEEKMLSEQIGIEGTHASNSKCSWWKHRQLEAATSKIEKAS